MTKHMYPQHVIAIFGKELSANRNDGLTFETRLADQWGNDDAVSAHLEICDLIFDESVSTNFKSQQTNASKLLTGTKAKLIIAYGLVDWASKKARQDISFSKKGEEVFIFWKVDELEFLNGITNAMKGDGKVWVKVDMFCDDTYFDDFEESTSYSINLYKISINFSK